MKHILRIFLLLCCLCPAFISGQACADSEPTAQKIQCDDTIKTKHQRAYDEAIKQIQDAYNKKAEQLKSKEAKPE